MIEPQCLILFRERLPGEAGALRGAIGYVPQRDINPLTLPVERALQCATEVRLLILGATAGGSKRPT